MRPSISQLLRRAQPGSSSAVDKHIKRAEKIAEHIGARWGKAHDHPHHWRVKHVRWYLEEKCRDLAPATRYEHWRTVRVVISACGRRTDWEPRLKGHWRYRTGEAGNGRGGRPPKLAHRAQTTNR